MLRTLALLTTTVLLTACAGRLESTVRKRASGDFQCPAEQVQVETQSQGGLSGSYVARGCGQESEYAGRCGLIGICVAQTPAEVTPAYASSDGGGSAPPPSYGDPGPAPAAGGSDPSSPAAPAGPTVVSVTLRNTCSETVNLFFGDKPKFGSGTYTTLGSNTTTSKQMQPGDMIWIVDDSQNGIASATIGETPRMTVEVTSGCAGLSAR